MALSAICQVWPLRNSCACSAGNLCRNSPPGQRPGATCARLGTRFPGGTLLDEFQASLVGRTLPGLSSTERFQLLRDAVERARAAGANPRDLLGQLRHA